MSDGFKFAPVTGDEPIYYVIDEHGVMTVDFAALYEHGKDIGRREILREIAAAVTNVDGADGDDHGKCVFCHEWTAYRDHEGNLPPHAPDCLWLRAQAAKER